MYTARAKNHYTIFEGLAFSKIHTFSKYVLEPVEKQRLIDKITNFNRITHLFQKILKFAVNTLTREMYKCRPSMHIQATSGRVFKVDTEFLKKYLDTSKNPGMPPGKTDGDALEKKVA